MVTERSKRKANGAVLDVLTDRSLLTAIAAFAPGIVYSAHLVKQQLVCASGAYTDDAVSQEDVALWQKAICAGDRATLDAFHVLSQAPVIGKRLIKVLSGILSYAVLHTKDFALLDWIDDSFDATIYKSLVTDEDDQAVGEQGDIEIVQWIFSREYGLYDSALHGAASKGHMDLVRFLHESEDFEIGCKEELITAAAENNHFHVITFALENIPECIPTAICRSSHDAINVAAAKGAIDMVKFLLERRPDTCTPSVMDDAAANGHLEIVQYLHENRAEGCTKEAMDRAAISGHLDVIRFLHEHREEGCTTSAMDTAATKGYYEIVKFLHENRQEGCTTKAMDEAATNGHLEIVKFLQENRQEGCTIKAMDGAAVNGHLEVVQFLHVNRTEGCRVDTLFECNARGFTRIAGYLCAYRPMAKPERAITRAKKESYHMLAAKIEYGAKAAKKTYVYR